MFNKKNEFKIVRWTDWEIANKKVEKGKYKDYWDDLTDEDRKKMRSFLVNYFLENRNELYKPNSIDGKINYPFNGGYHQAAEDGVPIIKYKGKLYAFLFSMRQWGDLMAEVFSIINGKKYMSMDEFWEDWEKEEKTKDVDENTYMYLDFWMAWDKLNQNEGDK
jgi:hypothetical protein